MCLHRILRRSDTEYVLVVDQFEKSFALCHDRDERERFVESMLYALADDDVAVGPSTVDDVGEVCLDVGVVCL
jgi:hypothetical protein